MYIAAITIHARPDDQNSSPEIEQEYNDDTSPVEITEPIKHTTPYKNKCALTAKKHDLTIREGEILVYLAKGRNAKYIAEKLFVAERTVKTHTYHIYQKLGIHSQQELIDIVESVEKEGNENKL